MYDFVRSRVRDYKKGGVKKYWLVYEEDCNTNYCDLFYCYTINEAIFLSAVENNCDPKSLFAREIEKKTIDTMNRHYLKDDEETQL